MWTTVATFNNALNVLATFAPVMTIFTLDEFVQASGRHLLTTTVAAVQIGVALTLVLETISDKQRGSVLREVIHAGTAGTVEGLYNYEGYPRGFYVWSMRPQFHISYVFCPYAWMPSVAVGAARAIQRKHKQFRYRRTRRAQLREVCLTEARISAHLSDNATSLLRPHQGAIARLPTLRAIGAAAQLASSRYAQSDSDLDAALSSILPPIRMRQYQLKRRHDGTPLAFGAWGLLSNKTIGGHVPPAPALFHPTVWNEGTNPYLCVLWETSAGDSKSVLDSICRKAKAFKDLEIHPSLLADPATADIWW